MGGGGGGGEHYLFMALPSPHGGIMYLVLEHDSVYEQGPDVLLSAVKL